MLACLLWIAIAIATTTGQARSCVVDHHHHLCVCVRTNQVVLGPQLTLQLHSSGPVQADQSIITLANFVCNGGQVNRQK